MDTRCSYADRMVCPSAGAQQLIQVLADERHDPRVGGRDVVGGLDVALVLDLGELPQAARTAPAEAADRDVQVRVVDLGVELGADLDQLLLVRPRVEDAPEAAGDVAGGREVAPVEGTGGDDESVD